MGWRLIIITIILIIVGCGFYVNGFAGWAQCMWVFASGTAGGAIVLLVEKR